MKRTITALLIAIGLPASIGGVSVLASDMQHRSSWNGTWVGNWSNSDGAQIIFAGNELIGFYWRGDYLSGTHATLSPAGVVTISWRSGSATLTRDGEATAHIVIHESGKADESFVLKRET